VAPPAADSIATLWARAKVASVMATDLRGVLAGNPNPAVKSEVVTLGESFGLVTQYTSFVAVDRLRVTIAGKPRLVHIPVELTQGTDPTGFFGGPAHGEQRDDDDLLLGLRGEMTEYAYIEDNTQVRYREVARVEEGEKDRVELRVLAEGLSTGAPATPSAPDVAGVPAERGRTSGFGESASKETKDAAQERAPGGSGGDKQRSIRIRKSEVPARDGGADRPASRGVDPAPGSKKPAQSPPPLPSPPPPSPAMKAAVPTPTVAPAAAPQPAKSEPPPAPVQAPGSPTGHVGLQRRVEPEAAGRSLTAYPANQLDVVTDGYKRSYETEPQTTYFGVVQLGTDMKADPRVYTITSPAPESQALLPGLLNMYFDANFVAQGAAGETSHDAAKTLERQRVVLAEHVILRIAALAADAKDEAAATMAKALGDTLPALAPAAELRRVYTDATVSADERREVVAREAKGARERLDGLRREALLRQRLDDSLLALTRGGDAALADKTLDADGKLLLSVLVEAVHGATLDELTKAGCTVESADEATRVVIVRCPVAKLRELALSENVRRVEATRD
jgi:hypothetical protein